ncbi:MAG: hypothetical protein OXN89_16790 [Bryobacterales bacterium]|nr:hypothetical protein [Bryobacterales bacterium]
MECDPREHIRRAAASAMQMFYEVSCTSSEYVKRKLWLYATAPECPWCAASEGCSLRGNGFYSRVEPAGTRIRRFLCRTVGRTVSLLPLCLASHKTGSVDRMEEHAHSAESHSIYKVAQEVEFEGAAHGGGVPGRALYRQVTRSVVAVAVFLALMRGMWPDRFAHLRPRVSDFRRHLGTDRVLVELRSLFGEDLREAPTPIGLRRERISAQLVAGYG